MKEIFASCEERKGKENMAKYDELMKFLKAEIIKC